MSPWWLCLIIPLSSGLGYVLGALMASGAAADQCAQCLYNQKKEEEAD